MKKLVAIILVGIGILLAGCQKEKDLIFLIAKDSVGKLERGSFVNDLETIFAADSVVRDTTELKLGTRARKVQVFENGVSSC